MTNADRALDLFARQYNCAQAVFAACGLGAGLDEQCCLALAAPFGGGLGRLGETCGAVSGALLALGLREGAPAATTPTPESKAALYARVGEFIAHFKARHGSIVCRDLLGCDISTPEGREQAQTRNLHQTLCRELVRSAAEILAAMAAEPHPHA